MAGIALCKCCYIQVLVETHVKIVCLRKVTSMFALHFFIQMRLKDPFSLKAADMTKRTNKPRKPRDEESSDEVSGKSLKQHRAPDC